MMIPLILSLSKGTRENGNPYPNRKPVVPAHAGTSTLNHTTVIPAQAGIHVANNRSS